MGVAEVSTARTHADLQTDEVERLGLAQRLVDEGLERRFGDEEEPHGGHEGELGEEGAWEAGVGGGEEGREAQRLKLGIVARREEEVLGVVEIGGDDEVGLGCEGGQRLGFEGGELGGAARPADLPPGIGGKRRFV